MSISGNMQVNNYGGNYTGRNQTSFKNPNAIEYFANTLQNAIKDKPDAPETARLKGIYEQLSENSKGILARMKNHQSISKEDWNALGQDLLANGAITQEEYDFTMSNVRLVSLSLENWNKIIDKNGNVTGCSRFSTSMQVERPFMASRLMARINGEDPDNWQDDPISFLDAWIENLRKMRAERDDNGNLNYRTDDIDVQIFASEAVKGLLNDLLAMI